MDIIERISTTLIKNEKQRKKTSVLTSLISVRLKNKSSIIFMDTIVQLFHIERRANDSSSWPPNRIPHNIDQLHD